MNPPIATANSDQSDFRSGAEEPSLVESLLRVVSTLRWDGVLPLIAPLFTILSLAFLPPGHPMAVVGTLFVPIGVALARAAVAQKQLDRAGNGLWRTFGLAIAIALLLVFEILSSFLGQVPAAPLVVWAVDGLLYPAYLLCICFALRPPSAGELERV